MSKGLTHINSAGEASMVDISDKGISKRVAVASGRICMNENTLQAIRHNQVKKGDVISVARIAGIMGAKRTADLIPLCHSLPLDQVELDFAIESDGILVTATTICHYRTGVEMEALTAVSVACLTLYDMCKALQKDMMIHSICLQKKSGGRSQDYQRKEA